MISSYPGVHRSSFIVHRFEMAVAEGFEPSVAGFAIRRLAAWRRAHIGTEGEIRTLESSLEDSHVSGYITSASVCLEFRLQAELLKDQPPKGGTPNFGCGVRSLISNGTPGRT